MLSKKCTNQWERFRRDLQQTIWSNSGVPTTSLPRETYAIYELRHLSLSFPLTVRQHKARHGLSFFSCDIFWSQIHSVSIPNEVDRPLPLPRLWINKLFRRKKRVVTADLFYDNENGIVFWIYSFFASSYTKPLLECNGSTLGSGPFTQKCTRIGLLDKNTLLLTA